MYSRVKMKPYSLDFRQKIFDTYLSGGISQRQLANKFCVSLGFIEKLLKQYRETASIAPKVRTNKRFLHFDYRYIS
ncbi:hypothetical protein [Nostoc sp. KVJ3]|uniref:hypothetical protein n=1 Tax=Nostoc sp. KVJ3 TaxID=457945 RepID=UPI0022376DF7|nr:hypothetical protein [Nostoc sp. KVJ3]